MDSIYLFDWRVCLNDQVQPLEPLLLLDCIAYPTTESYLVHKLQYRSILFGLGYPEPAYQCCPPDALYLPPANCGNQTASRTPYPCTSYINNWRWQRSKQIRHRSYVSLEENRLGEIDGVLIVISAFIAPEINLIAANQLYPFGIGILGVTF